MKTKYACVEFSADIMYNFAALATLIEVNGLVPFFTVLLIVSKIIRIRKYWNKIFVSSK